MGTSNWQNISYVIGLVRKLNPRSILDVGVGFGRWGILFREFLEIWEGSKYDGDWERIIDGVEIYPAYIKEYHKYFYTNIYLQDALDFLKKTESGYDLVNFGDVIEHFEKKQGEELLKLAVEKSKYVLATVPIGKHWPQAPTQNPYEEHKSVWYDSDFLKYKHCKLKRFKDFTLRDFSVALISKEKIKYDKRFGKYFGPKNILKHSLGLKKLVEGYEKRKR